MPYYNVDEVESALVGLSVRYPRLARLIELPNRTFEGRTVYALSIGRLDDGYRKSVLFTAGMHAREWGGPECTLNFAADLLEKYEAGAGLRYGRTTFDAEQVAAVVETMEVIVLPCVNPDGRHHSQEHDPMWRKNRRPNPGTGSIGTDINRNFDFLWHVHPTMSPSIQGRSSMASMDPSEDTYHGRSPASEPETRNVVWLLDQYPNIRWSLDIHCYGGDVIHPWGDAPNQNRDPRMNFRAREYDGRRGVDDPSVYAEYIDPEDERQMREGASRVCDAIRGVRDEDYRPSQSFYLVPTGSTSKTYPTTGTVDDYAYSRHLTDPWKEKVLAFTLEYGTAKDFQPDWEEMEQILLDVSAGMVQFCLLSHEPVVHLPFDPHVVPEQFRPDFWILSGIIDGGPGWVFVGGKPVWVKPPDPRIQELLTRVGEFLVAATVEGPGVLDAQRNALEKMSGLTESLYGEFG